MLANIRADKHPSGVCLWLYPKSGVNTLLPKYRTSPFDSQTTATPIQLCLLNHKIRQRNEQPSISHIQILSIAFDSAEEFWGGKG